MGDAEEATALALGILGGGQLGLMLAEAGRPLGFRAKVYDPARDACAAQAAEHEAGGFDDLGSLTYWAAGLELATYEWENVPVAAARAVAAKVPSFFPPIEALEMAQDRLSQKNFLNGLGIVTAPFIGVGSQAELRDAVAKLGLPGVLKTRRDGYDGKGQVVLRESAPPVLGSAWEALGRRPLVLEGFVRFERELSLIAVRGRDGTAAFYPLGENEHREGILCVTRVPARVDARELERLQTQAEEVAKTVMTALDYVGVLAIEFFHVGGHLLVNELATRVHNSGHWTQDGAATSQFENHLRAGSGRPLGPTHLLRPTAMVNLVGAIPSPEALAKILGARLHLYGKEPRPGRKLGHLNLPVENLDSALRIVG